MQDGAGGHQRWRSFCCERQHSRGARSCDRGSCDARRPACYRGTSGLHPCITLAGSASDLRPYSLYTHMSPCLCLASALDDSALAQPQALVQGLRDWSHLGKAGRDSRAPIGLPGISGGASGPVRGFESAAAAGGKLAELDRALAEVRQAVHMGLTGAQPVKSNRVGQQLAALGESVAALGALGAVRGGEERLLAALLAEWGSGGSETSTGEARGPTGSQARQQGGEACRARRDSGVVGGETARKLHWEAHRAFGRAEGIDQRSSFASSSPGARGFDDEGQGSEFTTLQTKAEVEGSASLLAAKMISSRNLPSQNFSEKAALSAECTCSTPPAQEAPAELPCTIYEAATTCTATEEHETAVLHSRSLALAVSQEPRTGSTASGSQDSSAHTPQYSVLGPCSEHDSPRESTAPRFSFDPSQDVVVFDLGFGEASRTCESTSTTPGTTGSALHDGGQRVPGRNVDDALVDVEGISDASSSSESLTPSAVVTLLSPTSPADTVDAMAEATAASAQRAAAVTITTGSGSGGNGEDDDEADSPRTAVRLGSSASSGESEGWHSFVEDVGSRATSLDGNPDGTWFLPTGDPVSARQFWMPAARDTPKITASSCAVTPPGQEAGKAGGVAAPALPVAALVRVGSLQSAGQARDAVRLGRRDGSPSASSSPATPRPPTPPDTPPITPPITPPLPESHAVVSGAGCPPLVIPHFPLPSLRHGILRSEF
jgi:hypothetical protein